MQSEQFKKLVNEYPYKNYVFTNFTNDKVLEDSLSIYEQNILKQFIESCKNGNILFIYQFLKYIPNDVLNEGILWICAKQYVNKDLQIFTLQSILKTNKISSDTKEYCKQVCKQYENDFLINFL